VDNLIPTLTFGVMLENQGSGTVFENKLNLPVVDN
jgi:hypothetical protein